MTFVSNQYPSLSAVVLLVSLLTHCPSLSRVQGWPGLDLTATELAAWSKDSIDICRMDAQLPAPHEEVSVPNL